MSTVFLKILNMSIAATWLIAVVLLVRLLLKKAPKWISCVLWALVALRLVIPFSLESPLSLLPSRETITYKNVAEEQQEADPAKPAENAAAPVIDSGAKTAEVRMPVIDSGVKVIDNALNPVIERAYRSENKTPASTTPSVPSGTVAPVEQAASDITPAPAASKADPLRTWTLIAAIVWIAGTAGLLIYALVSYLRLRKKVSASIPLWGNVRAADGIRTPFILGIFKPVIYVPSSLQGEGLDYVLAHEEAHLQRRDHLWKPLGYLLLAIYWFNPLCWVAYILLCRDIESACDEKAVKFMGHEEMAEYSQTLLNLSVQRHQIAACPVAFGEVNVKQRIRSILNYKKPAFCMVLVALLACIAVAGCFLTDPKKETDPGSSEAQTTEAPTDPTKEPTKEPTSEATQAPTTEPATEAPTTEAPSETPGETAGENTLTENEFATLLKKGSLSADMFSWFYRNEYNGEKVQIVPNRYHPADVFGAPYGINPVCFEGAVYYRAEEGQSFEEVIYEMEDAICGIFTQEENRERVGYVMTDYHIYPLDEWPFPEANMPEDNLRSAGEDVWNIRFLYIFYKYDGKDFGITFEEQKAESKTDEYGLISCFAQGSDDAFQMVLVKQGDVYLLAKPTYLTRHPEGKIYAPGAAPVEYKHKAVDSAKIALDFDEVLAKGEALDENAMKGIEAFFQKDSSPYPWYFIRQSFNDPSEIDAYLLFENGIDNEVSQEEQNAAWEASGAYGFGPQKRTIQSAREIFRKYTGTDLTDDQINAFSEWLYLPEYDAYYGFRTDATDDLRTHTLGRGVRLSAAKAAELGLPVTADGVIAVEWTGSTGAGPRGPQRYGMVLLIPDGDSYRIVANLVFEK